MKIKSVSFLGLITLMLLSCGKDELFIQRPVMEANAKGNHFTADKSVYAYYTSNPKQLFIYGTSKNMHSFYFMVTKEDTIPHCYSFIPSPQNAAFYKDNESDCNDKYYSTIGSPNGTGQLVLAKEDTVNRRLSGSFKYKAFRVDGDSVTILSGIFADVQYNMGEYFGNTFSAVAGGNPWTCIDVACEVRDNIRITAISPSLSMFVIDLPKDAKPAVYNLLPATSSVAMYDPNIANPDSQVSSSGTVEVTSHNTTDKVIAGKFKFTAKSALGTQTEITDGLFSVKYE